jgi:hypothetical protein
MPNTARPDINTNVNEMGVVLGDFLGSGIFWNWW